MPEKEGDEEKSTKSVVNKKQKQMMGEEGYDIARDEGRVKPSKDKKDATSYPPSDEVKKTQKKNKGLSAYERVKKKYEGQIMDLKKEELDLTQVAEAFGGHIIEASLEDIKKKYAEFSNKVKPDCLSIDYEVDPLWVKKEINSVAIQGGLDPKTLLEKDEFIEKEVKKYLDIFRDRPYVFNLGHGVLPETNPEKIKFVTNLVRDFK